MPAETSALIDLLDLKMLPAWVKEPAVTNSEHRGTKSDARSRAATWPRRFQARSAASIAAKTRTESNGATSTTINGRAFFAGTARLRKRRRANQSRCARLLIIFARPFVSPKTGALRCAPSNQAGVAAVPAWRKRSHLSRSPVSRKQRIPVCAKGFLQDRHHTDRADQGKLHERRARSSQRNVARADEPSQLSAALAQLVRTAL